MKSKYLDIIISIIFLAAAFCLAFPGLSKAATENNKNKGGADSQKTRIVIDAGHGGSDLGKIGCSETCEKDINLKIAKLVAKKLSDKCEIVLTRTEDVGLYMGSDSNKRMADLMARCEIANQSSPTIFVSIHQNSIKDSDERGAQLFYFSRSKEGKRLAETIYGSITSVFAQMVKRPVKSNNNYYLLLHTKCPTVVVECGFISNPEDEKLLISEDYQDKMASAIARGVEEYLH